MRTMLRNFCISPSSSLCLRRSAPGVLWVAHRHTATTGAWTGGGTSGPLPPTGDGDVADNNNVAAPPPPSDSFAPMPHATTPARGNPVEELHVPEKSTAEIAQEESQNQQRQVDPFRIGYNMGMQNVHLETLRNKLDDNLELLKSHFHSLREVLRTNHDALRSMQTEYNKQTRKQLDDGIENLRDKVDQLGARLHTNEETIRELTKQQFDSLQKHVDDRLENIKDTIKLSIALLLALQLWILFLVNQMAHSNQSSHNAPPNIHHGNQGGWKVQGGGNISHGNTRGGNGQGDAGGNVDGGRNKEDGGGFLSFFSGKK